MQPATVTYQFSGTVTSITDTSTNHAVPVSIQDNVSTYVGTFSFNNSATGQVSGGNAFYRGTALELTATVTIDNTYTYTLNTPSSSDEIDILGNSFEFFKRGPTVTAGFSPNPPFSHFEFHGQTQTNVLASAIVTAGSNPSSGVSDQQTAGAPYYFIGASNLTVANVSPPTVPPTSPPAVPPTVPPTAAAALLGTPQFAVGADAGAGTATLYNPDGTVRFTVSPFGTSFTGGVRTAAADFNGDGVADLVAGTGPGGPTQVQILDGKDQHVLATTAPFESAFTGGVYAAAGDFNGDGVPDLVVTPDQGGGPIAAVYDGAALAKGTATELTRFFGIDDPNFRGGARATVADLTGDGIDDLIVAAGFGGGPRVAGFDGTSLTGTPKKLFGDFFAFEQALRNGIFVTAGDVNGDGYADLIAGGGPGGGPRVLAFDGKSLLTNQYVTLANFFGGNVDSRGGIRLAVKDLDGDAKADLVVGAGAGAGSHVTAYLGKNISAAGTPPPAFEFDADQSQGGVYVG
ncbi:FG-GAP repeat domain-containing protein [Limnoglobus roseus]|uniref:FG-GAP repeat domain-containing protein n=1 Tax=Limnoglobus roseus TaxID=2598579 RepID=UPI0011EA82A9|nr:VCBS repeat-containing protein [Limnoglobus roseus]